MNKVFALYVIFTLLFLGAASNAASVTPHMHEKAAKVIEQCKELSADVLASRKLLVDDLSHSKKPGFLSSKSHKKLYDEKILYLKIFDDNFADYIDYVNKIDLTRANTSQKLAAILEPYSSNCIRFGKGLLGFTKWALGAGPTGFEGIYEHWVRQSRAMNAKLKHQNHFDK